MKNESLLGKIDCIYGESAVKQFWEIYQSDPEGVIPKALDTITKFVIGDPTNSIPGIDGIKILNFFCRIYGCMSYSGPNCDRCGEPLIQEKKEKNQKKEENSSKNFH